MFVRALLVAVLFAQAPLAASAACGGADPAIVNAVASHPMQDAGGLNRYIITITVANRGAQRQASNVLQSVAIFQDSQKVDQKGIPPLRPGQSYSFTHVYLRNGDAALRSTRFTFRLFVTNPMPPGAANCDTGNDRFSLRV